MSSGATLDALGLIPELAKCVQPSVYSGELGSSLSDPHGPNRRPP